MAYEGSLTASDLERIAAVRDQWMQTGLSTERCDRTAAEAAVIEAYRSIGLSAPRIIWMDSPFGGMFAIGAFQLRGQLGGQLGSRLWDQLGSQLGGQLWDQLGGQLWGQLRDQLGSRLWDQLGSQLWGQLGGQLYRHLSGWYDAYWLAFYGLAHPIAGLPEPSHLDTITTAVKALGWWWPYQDVAILTDRPTTIRRDRNGRLHSETGPALEYADGYAMHSWHGVAVPADFWTWDIKRALAESNSEIRRCAIERIGWDNITDQLTLVDSAPDPGNPGQKLRLYDLPRNLADMYEEPARILVVANASLDKGGHRRVFGLPVPAHHRDAVAAAADLFDVPVAAYRQLGRAA